MNWDKLLKVTISLHLFCIVIIHALNYESVYQNENGLSSVYRMPKRHATKLKVFIECRRDCSSKCNHSLFAYLSNENECYTCLIECMSAFTQQAEKIGIQLKDVKTINTNMNPMSDSLYAPGKKVRRRHLRQEYINREQVRNRV